jgi:hypothetical protein
MLAAAGGMGVGMGMALEYFQIVSNADDMAATSEAVKTRL